MSAGIKANNDGSAAIQVGGTDRVTLSSAGDVGVGTITPISKLDVVGPASVTSFTGTAKLGFSVRGSTGITDYSGVDFYGANNSHPTARIGVLSGGSGSSLVFGVSNNYASGITLAVSSVDQSGQQYSVVPGGSATLYPEYKCRAWVNFNGTGTVAIRASGNVSSITDNGTADYTVNFSTAMPDTAYAAVGITGNTTGGAAKMLVPGGAQTTTACRVAAYVFNASQTDSDYVSVSIFR